MSWKLYKYLSKKKFKNEFKLFQNEERIRQSITSTFLTFPPKEYSTPINCAPNQLILIKKNQYF